MILDEEKVSTENETEKNDVNYIEVITDMKKNTVSKNEYNKLLEENKKLLNAFVNGESLNKQPVEESVNINEIRYNLFNKDLTNLDYVKNTLTLRNELLKEDIDIFLPNGRNFVANNFDVSEAQKVADALEYCVDVADGNPDIFQNELQRICVDSFPQTKNFFNKRR